MRLREDIAEMPNGKSTIYGVCEFGQCVGVLPFIDRDHVVMVRQYRYVFGENHRWEMPTGGWKAGETLEKAEFLEVAVMPFSAVHDMVLSSEIRDGMTVIAVLRAAAQRAAREK